MMARHGLFRWLDERRPQKSFVRSRLSKVTGRGRYLQRCVSTRRLGYLHGCRRTLFRVQRHRTRSSDEASRRSISRTRPGAASAHHRPSAAAPLPTLHQVVRRAVQPATLFKPRALFPGAFSGQVPVARIKYLRVHAAIALSGGESPKLLSVAQFVGRRKRPASRDGGGAYTTA